MDIPTDFNIVFLEELSDPGYLMPLLLIGDESETMINRYLGRGRVFTGEISGQTVCVCVVTEESGGMVEIKNLAVTVPWRRHGIGRAMLRHVESLYAGRTLCLGTGETPSTLRFYHNCGYRFSHRVADFFTRNYPAPIIEEGVTLRDMIYLTKQC